MEVEEGALSRFQLSKEDSQPYWYLVLPVLSLPRAYDKARDGVELWILKGYALLSLAIRHARN